MQEKSGNTRTVQIYDDYVIKTPKCAAGVDANNQEAARYKENQIYYAACELLADGTLKMERLEDYTAEMKEYLKGNKSIKVPEYIDEFLKYKPDDYVQCGWSKDGRLKYFDYADVPWSGKMPWAEMVRKLKEDTAYRQAHKK